MNLRNWPSVARSGICTESCALGNLGLACLETDEWSMTNGATLSRRNEVHSIKPISVPRATLGRPEEARE